MGASIAAAGLDAYGINAFRVSQLAIQRLVVSLATSMSTWLDLGGGSEHADYL